MDVQCPSCRQLVTVTTGEVSRWELTGIWLVAQLKIGKSCPVHVPVSVGDGEGREPLAPAGAGVVSLPRLPPAPCTGVAPGPQPGRGPLRGQDEQLMIAYLRAWAWRRAGWTAGTAAGLGLVITCGLHRWHDYPMILVMYMSAGWSVFFGTVMDSCRNLLANWPPQDLAEIVRG